MKQQKNRVSCCPAPTFKHGRDTVAHSAGSICSVAAIIRAARLIMTTTPYLYFFVGLYLFSFVSPWQFLHAQTRDSSPSSRAREVLKAGAADSDPNTRRDVAVALSVVGSGDPVTELLATLAKDKDALVREAAIVSIGELKDARLSQAAKDALEDDVPE